MSDKSIESTTRPAIEAEQARSQEDRLAQYYARKKAEAQDHARALRRGGWRAVAAERLGMLADDLESLDAELELLAECLRNLRNDARFLRRDLAHARRAVARLQQKGDDHGT